MQFSIPESVFIASQEQLASPSYYRRLWIAARNMEIGRRRWLEEMANVFRDYRGIVYDCDGNEWEVPCVDETFGNDPEMRWLSTYFERLPTQYAPRVKSRKFERLRLIDLFFRIRFPELAVHFHR